MNTSLTKRDLRILGETSTGRDPGFLYVRTSIKKLLNGRPDVQKPWFAVAPALVNVSGRKGGLYFWAEIFNGRICSNVTVITVTRKFANYCNYSNVDLSAVSTGVTM